MMSKEKQIEEMSKDLYDEIEFDLIEHEYSSESFWTEVCFDYHKTAENIINKGYRKQSEPFSCGHEKGSEWISVEERLPEKEDDYLVYTTAGFIETDRFSVSEDKDVDGYWFELDDYVTHWMPFPEAPKVKGGAE
jgi:hypothetical protein